MPQFSISRILGVTRRLPLLSDQPLHFGHISGPTEGLPVTTDDWTTSRPLITPLPPLTPMS